MDIDFDEQNNDQGTSESSLEDDTFLINKNQFESDTSGEKDVLLGKRASPNERNSSNEKVFKYDNDCKYSYEIIINSPR